MFFAIEDLPPPPQSGYVPTTFHPETGDGFAIQLTTGVGASYGEFWVGKVSGGTLTLGWRYVRGRCSGSTAQVTAIDRSHQEVHFDAHGELPGWYIVTNSGVASTSGRYRVRWARHRIRQARTLQQQLARTLLEPGTVLSSSTTSPRLHRPARPALRRIGTRAADLPHGAAFGASPGGQSNEMAARVDPTLPGTMYDSLSPGRCPRMAKINRQRLAAEIEGDFVVFLIGMRINKPWKVHRWLPVFLAMPKMLKELEKQPEMGLLGYKNHLGLIAQYWRSFEDLEAYARSQALPAWVKFQQAGGSNGDVCIWHETQSVGRCVRGGVQQHACDLACKAGKLGGHRRARHRARPHRSQRGMTVSGKPPRTCPIRRQPETV
jgi:hypothetical protein